MSDIYDQVSAPYPAVGSAEVPDDSSGSAGKADAAKEQAGQLKDQAVDSGAQVAGTAKSEASKVLGETKTQAKDLLTQTQGELKDQAGVQQQRVAAGLRSVSDELGTLADKSDGGGVATDLVAQAGARVGSIATWLEDRDPGSLLSDVRAYAARKPGTFIAIAAIAGLAAGRLTKGLISNAADAKTDTTSNTATTTPVTPPVAPAPAETSYASSVSVPADYPVEGPPAAVGAGSFEEQAAFGELPDVETSDGDRP